MKVYYKSESERAQIIASNAHLRLVEDAVTLEGKYLRFSSEPDPEELMTLDDKKRRAIARLDRKFAELIASTDYVVVKMMEAQISGDDMQTLLEKYSKEINERRRLRQIKEEQERKILQAKDEMELAETISSLSENRWTDR